MKTVFVNREQAGKLVTPHDLKQVCNGYVSEVLLTTGAKLHLVTVPGGKRLAISGYAAYGSDVDSIIDNDEAISYRVLHKDGTTDEELFDIYTNDGVYLTTVHCLGEVLQTLGGAKHELVKVSKEE